MPISLGQIVFGIGPDTTRLRTSIQDIRRFGTTVEAAARAAAAGANTGEAALRRQEAAAISALQRVQRFQDQVARSAAPTNLAAGFNQLSTRGLDQFVARMTSGRLSALQFQREMERFGVTMNNSQRIFANWEKTSRLGALDSAAERLRQLSSAAVLVAGPLSGIAARISVLTTLTEHFNLTMAATVAGIAAGVFVFYRFSTAAIAVAKQLEQVENTLTAVADSQVIAQTQMKYLADFSDRAGVRLQDVAKSYGQILAASKGTNLEGERTNKIFEAIVLAGGKLGLSNVEVEASLRAVQQMMSKGVVQAEELKGQLGDRIPGAIQAMADALGVGTQKLFKMMEQGQVSSSVLVQFAEVLQKRYSIDENTKIDTIIAAENRLSNARTRLLQQLDKVIGVSDAYKNTLKFLTEGINGVNAQSSQLIPVLAAVAAGMVAAFAATALTTGMSAIIAGIRGITTAIATLNVAVAAGGAVTALGAIARLGIIIAGGTAGYLAMQRALKGTSDATLGALPAVDAYIKAQQTLKTSVRGATLEYIAQQEVLLKSQTAAADEALRKATQAGEIMDAYIAAGRDTRGMASALGLNELYDDAVRSAEAVKQTTERVKALKDILSRQSAEENKARTDPIKEMTNRQNLALKNARDTVKELNEVYDSLFLAPAAKEFALVQADINRQVENFRDQLTRTELPAATVTELVNNYALALRKVREGELQLRNNVSYFQAIEGVFSRGMDNALDGFITSILDGEDALESLKDTAKAVAQDIFKTMMTLAALNPLKNWLFGTNYQTLGGGAGIGGVLGSLFGGGSSMVGGYNVSATGGVNPFPVPFRRGGIMTSDGPIPLRSYRTGGIAHGPQYAEYGEGTQPEAFVPLPDGRSIPVSMQGGGGGGVELHIHESPGAKASVTTTKTASGTRMDIQLRDMVKGIMMEDIANGGEISNGLELQFGLNRATGLSR